MKEVSTKTLRIGVAQAGDGSPARKVFLSSTILPHRPASPYFQIGDTVRILGRNGEPGEEILVTEEVLKIFKGMESA